jgi:hypothetical protein
MMPPEQFLALVDDYMSWTQVFRKGFELWEKDYCSPLSAYVKREIQLCEKLQNCFSQVCQQQKLNNDDVQREVTLLGQTRLDFLLGKKVSLEVKFEPDYPDMPKSLKPVTNATLKRPDPEVTKTLAFKPEESQLRIGEIELDFLKLLAHKKLGVVDNFLFCLDEDGRLFRNLVNSFRTKVVRDAFVDWKTINRGIDGQTVHYFLWHA